MRYAFLLFLFLISNLLVAQTNIDSLELLIPQRNGNDKIDLLNGISFALWNKNPQKGIEYAQKAQKLSGEIDYTEGVAKSFINLGINYWAKGEFDKATTNLFEALSIYNDTQNKEGQKYAYNNLGIVYLSTNKNQDALKYFQLAKQIAVESKSDKDIISFNTNIGNAYINLSKFNEALVYFNENVELKKEHNLTVNLSPTLSNIGTCLMEMGRSEEAIHYIKDAYNYEIATDNGNYASMSANQIGKYYLKKDDFIEASKYLHKAEELAIEANALESLEEIQYNLSDFYKKTNRFIEALEYKDKYIATKDSIYNLNITRQITEIQEKFENAKKEEKINLLQKENQIKELEIGKQVSLRNSFIGISILVIALILIILNRYNIKTKANKALTSHKKLIETQKEELHLKNNELEKQFEELKVLNANKELFLKIISHDLKSPFNSILGFTELLSDEFNNFSDKEKLSFIDEINKTSRSAFELLENLLAWSQAQSGKIQIAKIQLDLRELIETSIAPYLLSASRKQISIEINIPAAQKVFLDKNTANTIIANLVSNAIKFTPANGRISIFAKSIPNFWELHILDSGVGMSPETIGKLFQKEGEVTTKGTNNESGTGLGLMLCSQFAKKNGGTISITSQLGKGSDFIFTFPMNTSVL